MNDPAKRIQSLNTALSAVTTTEEASTGSYREQGLLDQPGPRVTVYWTAHPSTTQEHVGELGVGDERPTLLSCSVPENWHCSLVRHNLYRWDTVKYGIKRSITSWDGAIRNRSILLHCQKALWKNLEIQTSLIRVPNLWLCSSTLGNRPQANKHKGKNSLNKMFIPVIFITTKTGDKSNTPKLRKQWWTDRTDTHGHHKGQAGKGWHFKLDIHRTAQPSVIWGQGLFIFFLVPSA